jgi:hypothetical protein
MRKAVPGMLADAPDWSDRAIAKLVGVDGKTVAAQREAHCGNSAVTPAERIYTTKHGTTATMKRNPIPLDSLAVTCGKLSV